MNNKRQTIWLVSMLSLMVILSAYYLFTEDATPARDASGGIHQTETHHADSSAQIEIIEMETSAAGSMDEGISPDDEAVLKNMANLSGSDMITELQRQRMEKFASESEKLSAIVADTKNYSQEQASAAMEQMARLEDTDERMTSLEEKLLQEFDNAVVTEEKTHFQVVVQTPKLEKQQAVKIIEMAAKELNVTPDRLSVKYVQ
jgi:stage III sporulation protein AH